MIEKLERPTAAGEALHDFYMKLYALQSRADEKSRERKISRLLAEHRWLERLLINRGMGFLPRDYMSLKYFRVPSAHAYWLQRVRKPVDPTLEDVVDEVIEHDVRKHEAVHNGGEHYLSGFSGYNASEINDTLRERTGFLITDSDTIRHRDDVGECQRSGAIVENDELYTVVVAIGPQGAPSATEQWCESERDNCAFWCEASENWYSSSDFTETDYAHGGSICTEFAVANGRYMWSERREFFVHEREWDFSEHGWEDENEDDEGNRMSQYMAGYHDGRKHHFDRRIKIARRSMRLFFGYEIELLFNSFDDREEFMAECRRQNLQDVVFERDGSLQDDDCGVELIFPPYSIDELRNPNGEFARVMALAVENGAYTDQACGVHITVNTATMLERHTEQFIRAVYAMHRVSVFVAGRDTDKLAGRTSFASFKNIGHVTDDTKYAAVNQRENNTWEFRLFDSSTEHDTLLSYADYIAAIREWTRDPELPAFANHHVRADAMTTAAFRRFVTDNRHTYPNLAARFGRQLKEAA